MHNVIPNPSKILSVAKKIDVAGTGIKNKLSVNKFSSMRNVAGEDGCGVSALAAESTRLTKTTYWVQVHAKHYCFDNSTNCGKYVNIARINL